MLHRCATSRQIINYILVLRKENSREAITYNDFLSLPHPFFFLVRIFEISES